MVTPLVAFAMPLIEPGPFVNAGGLVAQSALAAATFVIPFTAISQVAVPAFMVADVTLIVDGAVSVTVAAHPMPTTVAVAPGVRRNPDGRVSTKMMPACAGLPAELVRRKLSGVLLPTGIDDETKLLVNCGNTETTPPTVTATELVTNDCGINPTNCVEDAVLEITVPAGGICAMAAAEKHMPKIVRASPPILFCREELRIGIRQSLHRFVIKRM